MAWTLKALYHVKNDVISPIEFSAPVGDVLKHQTYAIVTTAAEMLVLDVSHIGLRETPPASATVSISDFLSTTVSDAELVRYRTDTFPIIDADTGRYTHRLHCINATSHPLISVSRTTLTDGANAKRDDPYRRFIDKDLVITHTSDDLTTHLVAVNGVFHRCHVNDRALWVVDGYTNIRNTQKHEIALVDTKTIGGHTIVPLTADMMIDHDNTDIRRGLYLSTNKSMSLADKTVWLVVAGRLHTLDGSYTVVNETTIKINTSQLHLIDDFLHHPLTPSTLTHGGVVAPKNPYLPTDEVDEAAVDPIDGLTWFFQEYSNFHVEDGGSILVDLQMTPLFADKPSIDEGLHYLFNEGWRTLSVENNASALIEIDYSDERKAAAEITPEINMDELTSQAFVASRLFHPHSFLVVINTPHLYRRVYRVQNNKSLQPYVIRSNDTPRGMLRYDHFDYLPYTIVSSDHRYTPNGERNHALFINHSRTETDAYRTSLFPTAISAPYYDRKSSTPQHKVELIEWYAP